MVGNFLNKTLKIIGAILLFVIVGVLFLGLYFNSKSGQKKLSHLVFGELSKQIGTPVTGELSFSIPDWINIENLYIPDRNADSLLFAKKAHLDIALWQLLKNHLEIEKVVVEDVRAQIYKKDDSYNFDYILEAFSSPDSEPGNLKISLKELSVDRLRAKYNEKDIGQDIDLKISSLQSGFQTFNPERDLYFLKDSKISGLNLTGSLGQAPEDTITSESTPLPDIRIKNLVLEDINWNLDLGESLTRGEHLNLKSALKDISLPEMSFNDLTADLSGDLIAYRNKDAKPTTDGEINFSDLVLEKVELSLKDFSFKDSTGSGTLTRLKFVEKSGLELKNITSRINYQKGKLTLDDLDIATGQSWIKGRLNMDIAEGDFSKSRFEAQISELKLALNEALYLDRSLSVNPTFKSLSKEILKGNGKINGTFSRFELENIQLSALGGTQLALKGTFGVEPMSMDLDIPKFITTSADLKIIYPDLPDNLPGRMAITGNIKGNLADLDTRLRLNTSLGGGNLDLNLKNIEKTPEYSGHLTTEGFALGKFLNNPEIGALVAGLSFQGKGFDKPLVNFDGNINSLGYGGKTYRDLQLEGTFKNYILTTQGRISDPELALDLKAEIDLNGDFPLVEGKTNLKNVNLKMLGLLEEDISIAGVFDVRKLILDKKNPFIDFVAQNVKAVKDGKEYPINRLSLFTNYGEDTKSLDLTTDFVKISLSGNFEYDQLSEILKSEVNQYFKLPGFEKTLDSLDYYFDINGSIKYDPVFTAFMPSVLDFDPIQIQSNLSSSGDIPFSGKLLVPALKYDSIQVLNTVFEFKGDGEVLNYNLTTHQVSNPSFRIRNGEISGKLQDNKADFSLEVKDDEGNNIHSLAGFLESDGEAVKISFDETGSMLFYENWGGNPYGFISYSADGLFINNVVFSSGNQILRINTLGVEPNTPLMLFTKNIDLNFLSQAILQDSLLISGRLDMDIVVSDYVGDAGMKFQGETDIRDLVFREMPLGDLTAKAESENLEKISIFAYLKSELNEVEMSGAYFPEREENLDFRVEVAALDLNLIKPFVDGVLYDINGRIFGDLEITGPLQNPVINGLAEFKGASLRIQETGALIKVSDDKIIVNNSGAVFSDFRLLDEKDEMLLINGTVNFADIRYDLDLSSENFLFVNSQRGQSDLFYGTAFVQSRLNLKGVGTEFRLTGDITAKPGSNLTLLLPDDDFGQDLSTVIHFVNFSEPGKKQSIQEDDRLSLANAVNVNVYVDDRSTINMLMDPISGDMLSGKGEARLNIGFDNAGDLFIVGLIEIKEGSYDLTFQTINKRFEITPVSKSNISFTGDPLKGQINITAEYSVPGKKDIFQYPELNQDDFKGKKKPVPLRVDLILTGEVMQPQVDFQIVAKKDDIADAQAQQELEKVGVTMIDDKGIKESGAASGVSGAFKEILKQNAIMLMVAGNFTASQIFESLTSSTGAAYEDLARRNASQIISSQLEKYASGLIKGIDLNVGLESSGGMAETGSDRSTNLNLGVSKRLADDRLIVSVGKNFELENKNLQSDEVFDNVEANWLITPEGRYRLKVFRKTQNQSAIEGSVIETGLGFIIAIDYDTWIELIKKKK